jgi:Mrp family chromosome partitioning ATPase
MTRSSVSISTRPDVSAGGTIRGKSALATIVSAIGDSVRNGAKPTKLERSFDALRLRLLATDFSHVARNDALVVVVTARTRGEGTSTVANGLADTFSRNGDGRVLLLDADERGNIQMRERGSDETTVVRDLRAVSAALPPPAPATRENAHMPVKADSMALAVQANPFTAGAAFAEFFATLRVRYDIVVVDAGALDTPTPYFWAGNAQKVVLVVDCDRTTRPALERLRRELDQSNLKISGVVLNNRDFPIPRFFY